MLGNVQGGRFAPPPPLPAGRGLSDTGWPQVTLGVVTDHKLQMYSQEWPMIAWSWKNFAFLMRIFLIERISIFIRWQHASENHTVRKGAYNAPIDLSSYEGCRDEFWGIYRTTLELCRPKFWESAPTPSGSKRVEFPKCWLFWQKRTAFRFSVLARSLL